MSLWLALTLTAAFLQNVRSSVQKHLKGRMGTSGATLVRFLFGWPFALLYLGIIVGVLRADVPTPSGSTVAWTAVGAVAQIGAQVCLLAAFTTRNFAAGSAYARVEPVAAALLAPALLGETVAPIVWFGIGVSVCGVLLLTTAERTEQPSLARQLTSPGTALGLGSAALFGLSSVSYRAAALSLEVPQTGLDGMVRGAMVNSFAIVLQTIILSVWLTVREPEQWRAIRTSWRPALLTGFVGATASLGWFAAFALQQAAVVKAVAQVELLFAVMTSAIVFRERIKWMELLGAALVAAGVIVLIL